MNRPEKWETKQRLMVHGAKWWVNKNEFIRSLNRNRREVLATRGADHNSKIIIVVIDGSRNDKSPFFQFPLYCRLRILICMKNYGFAVGFCLHYFLFLPYFRHIGTQCLNVYVKSNTTCWLNLKSCVK